MGTKRRTVVNAEPRQIERAMVLVKQGRYRTLSDFVREAVDEKLARIDDALLEDEVARYCAAGHAIEDVDLVTGQSFDPNPRSRRPSARKASRAAR
jgi:Arc/MetJ-type ribon-helix-helix transcriptional regulator